MGDSERNTAVGNADISGVGNSARSVLRRVPCDTLGGKNRVVGGVCVGRGILRHIRYRHIFICRIPQRRTSALLSLFRLAGRLCAVLFHARARSNGICETGNRRRRADMAPHLDRAAIPAAHVVAIYTTSVGERDISYAAPAVAHMQIEKIFEISYKYFQKTLEKRIEDVV